jgi:hypothetical protein
MPVISAHRRLRQEDLVFQVSPGYSAKLFFFLFKMFFKNYLYIFSYVYALFGPLLLPAPCPPPPSLPGRNCSALFSNFVEEKT